MATDPQTVRAVVRGWIVRLGLAALAIVLAYSSPVPAELQSVRFAVIGDFGSDNTPESDVANLVKSWNPDLVLTVGDNNYDLGEASTIDRNIGKYYRQFIYPYVGSYGSGSDTNRLFPSIGNHDYNPDDGLRPYLDYFVLPNNERYYDFYWGSVRFFAVNSDRRELDGTSSTSDQAQWLRGRLGSSTSLWNVVYFHHPPHTSGSSAGGSSWMRWPFQDWGATTTIAGHQHIYERLIRNGFPQFVNGLGGESRGSFSTTISGSVVRYRDDFGAMLVEASGDSIRFRFYARSGQLVDNFLIEASTPAAPSDLQAMAVSSSRIDLSWTDNSSIETGSRIYRSLNGSSYTLIDSVGTNRTGYSDSGLAAGTTYYYRVQSFNAVGDGGASNIASAATPSTDLAAPANLLASAVSESRVDLSWSHISSEEDGFEIERSIDGAVFALIAAVGENATDYSDTGVQGSRTYYYRVRAFNESGVSAYSNTATAVTPGGGLPAPTSLTASTVTTCSSCIDLRWEDTSSGEDGFRIEQSSDGSTFAQVATAGANATSYRKLSLQPSTLYYFRIRAYYGTESSGYSNVASATTAPNKPASPSNLDATAVSSSRIDVQWTDNADNEDGFNLYRSKNGGSFYRIAVLGPNVTSFSNAGLSGSTTFSYRVRAFNVRGSSSYSNTDGATTF